ncbi:MAG: hypothetical protein HYY06_22275 [Deltaproteobacteria bacterium]|nr:hypothetical protein [Deltaproteobacteria bacterium]
MKLRVLAVALVAACGGGDDGGGPRLDRLAVNEADPLAFIALTGRGLDADPPIRVRFFDDAGTSMASPAIEASGTSLLAPVPPLFDPDRVGPVSGLVQVEAIRDPGGASPEVSNAVGHLAISELLVVSRAPGDITAAVLGEEVSHARELVEALADDPLGTPEIVLALEDLTGLLERLATAVDAVRTGAAAEVSIGTLDGFELFVDAEALALADRIVVSAAAGLAPQAAPAGTHEEALGEECFEASAERFAREAPDEAAGMPPWINEPVRVAPGASPCLAGEAALTAGKYLFALTATIMGAAQVFAGVAAAELVQVSAIVASVQLEIGAMLVMVGATLDADDPNARRFVAEGAKMANEALVDPVRGLIVDNAARDVKQMIEGAATVHDLLAEAAEDLDECEPDCEDLECGDDGCGGSCGDCGEGSGCIEGACESTGPCGGVSGTWFLECAGTAGCNPDPGCDPMPSSSMAPWIDPQIALAGGSWEGDGRTFTFDPRTCTLSWSRDSECGVISGAYTIEDGQGTGTQQFYCYMIDTAACLCVGERTCTAAQQNR